MLSRNFKLFCQIKENSTNSCEYFSFQFLLGAAFVTTRAGSQKTSYATDVHNTVFLELHKFRRLATPLMYTTQYF
jgi:hypothetical protein